MGMREGRGDKLLGFMFLFSGFKKIEACLSAIVIALNDHKPVSQEQGGTSRLKEGGHEWLST